MPRPPAPTVTPVRSGGPSMALIGGVVVLIVTWAVAEILGHDEVETTNGTRNAGRDPAAH